MARRSTHLLVVGLALFASLSITSAKDAKDNGEDKEVAAKNCVPACKNRGVCTAVSPALASWGRRDDSK